MNKPFPLIDIVEERKRNAGGACSSGSGAIPDDRNNGHLRYMKSQSFDGNVEDTWLLVKMYAMRSMLTDESLLASCFKLESLILAQNERWRQA